MRFIAILLELTGVILFFSPSYDICFSGAETEREKA